MGNVSLWTYSVILLCLCGITFGQRFPYENPSSGCRNVPSKLNLRNFLGSKLIERLADNPNNSPQYEPYQHQMSNPIPNEQMVHQPPPPPQALPPSPLPPSFSRGVVPYEYQNQRIPVQPPPQSMGSPRQLMNPPPSHPMDPPPHLMGPPTQHVSQSNMHENVYTETITSSCPECEAANQDYSYQEEPCSCCEGGCPCSCEECPCCCKGRGRCPCYPDDGPYCPDKEYTDRDQSYDDYPSSDCPCCCCDSAGSHECPDSFAEEPPQYRRERPSHRGYPQMKQMNGNYMEGPDSQIQRESYHFKPREGHRRRYQQFEEPMEPPQFIKMPPRRTFMPPPDMPPQIIHQAPIPKHPEEPMHRHHMPEPIERIMQHPQMQQPVDRVMQHPHMQQPVERVMQHQHMPEPMERVMQHQHMPEPMERVMQHQHMPEPMERVMQHQHMPEMADRTIHHTEITERAMHRFHEAAPPMPMPPVDSHTIHQEGSRVSEWQPVRMPPPGHPRHMVKEEPIHPEPPVQMYRNYQPVSNRFVRKFRQPSKPPFFDGLSYNDGC